MDILHKLEGKIQQNGVGDPEPTYKIAQGYAVLGDKISALRALRQTIQNGFFSYPYFMTDPLLTNIRNEPQFTQEMLVARRRYQDFRSKFFGR